MEVDTARTMVVVREKQRDGEGEKEGSRVMRYTWGHAKYNRELP